MRSRQNYGQLPPQMAYQTQLQHRRSGFTVTNVLVIEGWVLMTGTYPEYPLLPYSRQQNRVDV